MSFDDCFYGPTLSKEALEILGVDKPDGFMPFGFWGTENRDRVSDLPESDQEVASKVLKASDEYLLARLECRHCESNRSKSLGVCSAHYHDYIVCEEPHCVSCFIYRSLRKHYPSKFEELGLE